MADPPAGIRRVVTGHTDRGQAMVVQDHILPAQPTPGGDARFTLLWSTGESPADNADPQDGAARVVGLVSVGGSVLRMVDMAPGGISPKHRTQSLDYGIVLSGQVDMLLDDGAVVRLRAGDVVVQRGTIHAWSNPTESWCRIAFVLLAAEPLDIANAETTP